jgi:hypothetical protein
MEDAARADPTLISGEWRHAPLPPSKAAVAVGCHLAHPYCLGTGTPRHRERASERSNEDSERFQTIWMFCQGKIARVRELLRAGLVTGALSRRGERENAPKVVNDGETTERWDEMALDEMVKRRRGESRNKR